MSVPAMPGVTARTITTSRLTTRVLFTGPEDATPVFFLHGNTSSATWWEETMVALPEGYRGIAPDQRGFGEADPQAKIDATRGMGDLADDAAALLNHLGIEKAHIVGNSLGGMVIWRLLTDHPEIFLTATVVDPGSPYGFGATKDLDGTPTTPDFAGSGGGLSNPELIKRLKEGDRSMESQFSPRAALRTLLVKPPFIPPREEELLSAMLSTHIGEKDVPGDSVQSPNWPHMAPGRWGASNATSPKYVGDVNKIIESEPKTSVLWVRGSHDLAQQQQPRHLDLRRHGLCLQDVSGHRGASRHHLGGLGKHLYRGLDADRDDQQLPALCRPDGYLLCHRGSDGGGHAQRHRTL